MKHTIVILVAIVLLLPLRLSAENFFVTKDISVAKNSNGMSYSVKVDFPIDGSNKAISEIRKWICECVCEYDNMPESPQDLDSKEFQNFLNDCSLLYFGSNSKGCREKIEIYRSYEDEEIVTYEMETYSCEGSDKDAWRDDDCVSVSKKDGHRIQADEVFNCGENKIKQLMWQWRGELPVSGLTEKELVVGNVAYTDGWIVVIGPANGYTGAAYRIRYQAAEPFLKGNKNGDYYNE